MRVECALRRLRGTRSLRELERETGIHRGALSRYETGKEFPRDKHVQALELAYGAPSSDWWPPHVLAELHPDGSERVPTPNQARQLAAVAHGHAFQSPWPERQTEALLTHQWIWPARRPYGWLRITPAGLRALAAAIETHGAPT